MSIVKCSHCGKEYNSVLPVCPSCGLDVSMSVVIDEISSLHDGTGGKDFKIINRLNTSFGSDVTIFKKDSHTYGVAQSIRDIVLPRMNYACYSYIDETVTNGFLRVNINNNGTKKWGIIDVNGSLILPVVYDNIWRLKPQFIDITRIEINGKHYIVDLTNNISLNIIKLLHEEIHNVSDTRLESQNNTDKGFVDEVCSVFNRGLYNDALDVDQQSPEFWESI